MDACIARGGISHVLSQARASLKNPSRPFTPRTDERPLFHGDDYRPGSRPSSSYSVAEHKGLESKCYKKVDDPKHPLGVGPSGASLPPRPAPTTMKARPVVAAVPPAPEIQHVKLMHAPLIHDHQAVGEPSEDDASDDDRKAFDHYGSQRVREDDDPLESSLEIPSSEGLAQALNVMEKQLRELGGQSPDQIKPQTLDSLVDSIAVFGSSSAIHLTAGSTARRAMSSRPTSSPEATQVAALRRRLYDGLTDVAVGSWHTSAKCVISIASSIFDLFALGFGDSSYNDENTDAKLVALGKVLFVLSKESQNDDQFCNVRYVESALSLIASANSLRAATAKTPTRNTASCPMKTLIYIAGTLKNISSGDDKMLKLLATNGAIATLGTTLLWRSKDQSESKEIAQFLVQTTTILRNLSTSKSYLKQFNEAHVAARVCELIPRFIHHQELMVNVSRILGKLTLHEVPRSQINQNVETNVGNLVKLVDPRANPTLSFVSADSGSSRQNQGDNKSQDPLLIRIFFVLGNLCASNDRNRQFLGGDADPVPILLEALAYYGTLYIHSQQQNDQQHTPIDQNDSSRGRSGDCTEVLVKLVRLIANMAINAEVGARINAHRDEMTVLLEVLDCAQASERDEELKLNIVSCFTNLSYYCTAAAASASFIESNRLEIASELAQILWDTNEEAVLEAARAFGNLSRFKDVLKRMGDEKVLDCFVVLLDHSNREIVYTVCGVLMNAALDEASRAGLLNVRQVHSGAGDGATIDARTLLVGILECAALDDIEMSCIAAKVLYNLLLSTKDDSPSWYVATEDGRTLRRVVSSVLKSLGTHDGDQDDEQDDEDASQLSSRRELRGVLSQLKKNLERYD